MNRGFRPATATSISATATTSGKRPNEAARLLYPLIADNFTAFVEQRAGIGDLPIIHLVDLNNDFWAHSLGFVGNATSPLVFSQPDGTFLRHNPDTGTYQVETDEMVMCELGSNLDACAALFNSRVSMDSFVALKSRNRLKAVVNRAKLLLRVDLEFFGPKPHHLPVRNGILDLSKGKLLPFHPMLPFKSTLPVSFDPDAKCDVFLKSFLAPVVRGEDIELLQRYLSQLLEGRNHTQTILLLNGESGWGKSTLIKIIGSIFGWSQAGIIREQVFKDAQELSHYQGKRFLLHPDMPTDFLDRPEGSLFKQLVGGDPLWAEGRNGSMTTIEGNFPCILACNGQPRLHLDSDHEAWIRRLLVVPFLRAGHDTHFGKMAELIVKNEAPGILNWLLEGRRKLVKARFQMNQAEEQQARTKALVMASLSPKTFVQQCLARKEGAEMTGNDLYARYQQWCVEHRMTPFAGQYFNQMAKEEIEISLGLRYRHDLITQDGTAVRGWKHLAVMQNAEIESKVSGERFEPDSKPRLPLL